MIEINKENINEEVERAAENKKAKMGFFGSIEESVKPLHRKILLASNNKNKLKEFKRLFSERGIEIITPAEVGIIEEPVETGLSFKSNARLKAKWYHDEYMKLYNEDILAIAEDSGLCIHGLNMSPGVFTARWYKMFDSIDKAHEDIFRQLVFVKDKGASVIASMSAYSNAMKGSKTIESTMECTIPGTVCSENGFMFDWILKENTTGMLVGLMSEEEKDKVSHRGKAMRGIYNILTRENII